MAKKKTAKREVVGRQGDVLFVRDDSLKVDPTREVAPEGGRLVLAIGETSGHCHAVDASKGRLYTLFERARQAEDVERVLDRVLEITAKATVRVESTSSRARMDERHTPIELPPGRYRVRVMQEYSPQSLRSVAD